MFQGQTFSRVEVIIPGPDFAHEQLQGAIPTVREENKLNVSLPIWKNVCRTFTKNVGPTCNIFAIKGSDSNLDSECSSSPLRSTSGCM